jgi:hypothetical protein
MTIEAYKEGPCEDCGEMSEPGDHDLAIHDCEAGEWLYLTMNVPATKPLTPPHTVFDAFQQNG